MECNYTTPNHPNTRSQTRNAPPLNRNVDETLFRRGIGRPLRMDFMVDPLAELLIQRARDRGQLQTYLSQRALEAREVGGSDTQIYIIPPQEHVHDVGKFQVGDHFTWRDAEFLTSNWFQGRTISDNPNRHIDQQIYFDDGIQFAYIEIKKTTGFLKRKPGTIKSSVTQFRELLRLRTQPNCVGSYYLIWSIDVARQRPTGCIKVASLYLVSVNTNTNWLVWNSQMNTYSPLI
jgi:hypothetical protein